MSLAKGNLEYHKLLSCLGHILHVGAVFKADETNLQH